MPARRVNRRDTQSSRAGRTPFVGKALLAVLLAGAVMGGIALGSTLQIDSSASTDLSASTPATLVPTPTTAPAPARPIVVATATAGPALPTPKPTAPRPQNAPTPSPTAARSPTVAPTPTFAFAPEKPAPLFAAVLSMTTPITRGQATTLTVQTMPRAQVGLSVHYGEVAGADLGERQADPTGRLTWSWTVDPAVPTGPARAVLTATLRGLTVTTEAPFVVR